MRALLVDDSLSSLSNLKRLLEPASPLTCGGYSDPIAALEAARGCRFDTALIDDAMPGMDGIALIRSRRAMAEDGPIPIAIITTRASESPRIEALETGATGFLPKSPDAAEIKARLRNMVDFPIAFRKRNDNRGRARRADFGAPLQGAGVHRGRVRACRG